MQIGSNCVSLSDSRIASFRRAASDDEPFLLEVYGSTRAEELDLTNWDQSQRDAFLRMQLSAQQSHYREVYPEGEHYIILVNGDALGRLYVAEIENEVRILDITILPQHRNTGIGKPIIGELMAEAAAVGKPLRIYVESYNASLGLFDRLGFVKTGESGYSYLMEWRSKKDDQIISTS
jgi:ribosomal protein S18 acetylase RimI-like enzyme